MLCWQKHTCEQQIEKQLKQNKVFYESTKQVKLVHFLCDKKLKHLNKIIKNYREQIKITHNINDWLLLMENTYVLIINIFFGVFFQDIEAPQKWTVLKSNFL